MAIWLEAAVSAPPARLEALTAFFTASDFGGFAVEDEDDVRQFLEDHPDRWDYVDPEVLSAWHGVSRVKCYLPQTENAASRLRTLRQGLDALAARIGCAASDFTLTVTPMDSEDWENSWRQYYRPMTVGERLYILPAWEDAPAPEGRVILRMDPGLTFGTGSHPSTRLCLEAAERWVRPGARVLDLGCGSGILSLAALLLGAKEARGCDLREEVAAVTAENAALNGLPPFPVRIGDILTDADLTADLTDPPADLIFANIVADVIIALAPEVPGWLTDHGIFICSGIIDTRAAETEAALLAAGFTVRESLALDDWRAFVCEK